MKLRLRIVFATLIVLMVPVVILSCISPCNVACAINAECARTALVRYYSEHTGIEGIYPQDYERTRITNDSIIETVDTRVVQIGYWVIDLKKCTCTMSFKSQGMLFVVEGHIIMKDSICFFFIDKCQRVHIPRWMCYFHQSNRRLLLY